MALLSSSIFALILSISSSLTNLGPCKWGSVEQDIKKEVEKEKKFTKFHPGTHNTYFEMFRKEAII